MKKLTETGTPFLIIQMVRAGLRLYYVDTQKNWLGPGLYEVLAGDEWIRLEAAQLHILTSGQPTRAIELYDAEAETLLHLEEYLLAGSSPLQLKAADGACFTVGFPRTGVKSSFYVSGNYVTEIKWDGMPLLCRIVLPEDKTFLGTGYQAQSCAGKRQMAIGDLSLSARLAITRAVAAGESVVVENIP